MSRPIEPGAPSPLGAVWDGEGVNFALFSAHAEKVELCLQSGARGGEIGRYVLPGRTGDVWHGRVPGLAPGVHYGFRVHGPYAPSEGHRFNPAKLLLDPYGRAVSDIPRWGTASYDFQGDGEDPAAAGPEPRDSAPLMPRSVVIDPAFDWGDDRPPATPWSRTVIYEAHAGGLTRLHPALPPEDRGTFRGLAHPQVIAHLRSLGVTAVELMPVQAFVDDPFLVRQGLANYWGYSTMAFFAPDPRYLGGAGPEAFKAMVRALHADGLEVILDVVYNHTAEGNHQGPTLSFRGIDNASYYRLAADRSRYEDFTGCGNTLDLGHPQVRTLVLDSLRYWVEHMRVDGFRFDLATTLARGAGAFEPFGAFFKAVAADPVLRRVKLIAEPWDLGPEGYRLGGFPPGWAEWNDRYRDTVRAFWLDHGHVLPEFARRVHGSGDLFDHPGRGPWASINFVASHDGFTLRDTVSYEQRHNEANGEGNRDGHASNHSRNHGVEGHTDDPGINALRQRQARNLLATVFLSQGTPMLLAGDEMGRTQDGNNNAYCQDNGVSWVDWSRLPQERGLVELVGRLARLRGRHALLRRGHFVHGEEQCPVTDFRDIEWLRPGGGPMTEHDWHDPRRDCVGVLLATPAVAGQGDALLVVFNAGDEPTRFALPGGDGFDLVYRGWFCALTTGGAAPVLGKHAEVEARSVSVFEALAHGESP